MAKATKPDLVGRSIVDVDFRAFRARPEQKGDRTMAHAPVLILDNGDRVHFMTEETDVGEYGTCILITKKGKS